MQLSDQPYANNSRNQVFILVQLCPWSYSAQTQLCMHWYYTLGNNKPLQNVQLRLIREAKKFYNIYKFQEHKFTAVSEINSINIQFQNQPL
jgi:hypothetical protein